MSFHVALGEYDEWLAQTKGLDECRLRVECTGKPLAYILCRPSREFEGFTVARYCYGQWEAARFPFVLAYGPYGPLYAEMERTGRIPSARRWNAEISPKIMKAAYLELSYRDGGRERPT